MINRYTKSLSYLFARYILRKQFLVAREKKFGMEFKFKSQDAVGRKIYKTEQYEHDLSFYLAEKVSFKPSDIALDIGANIGWYSMLLNQLMPDSCKIYAFEPDPLNFRLLSNNITRNSADKIIAVEKALSNKTEVKKLFQYESKNLGRHSLLNINDTDFVDVQAVTLDGYLLENGINLKRIKFAKIDIEGYELCSLLGAAETLKYIQCLITEFSHTHMTRGGIEPRDLTDLLTLNHFIPHIFENSTLQLTTTKALLSNTDCDVIWLKQPGK